MKSDMKGICTKAEIITLLKLVFTCVFLAICIIPSVGLLWDKKISTADDAEYVEFPHPFDEKTGEWNIAYLNDLGTYFEDHFAFRDEMIDIDAHIKVDVLGTAPNNQVIVGKDGWLFYEGTASDFLGTDILTQREAKNIAHNLTLVQGYVRSRDAEFVFTVAPNKNSLYPDHMPYYYLKGENQSMDMLRTELENADVNYVDAFEIFKNQEEELYFKTDSHWTNEGASLVVNKLLSAGGYDQIEISVEGYDNSFVGDVEQMAFPTSASAEGVSILTLADWEYLEGESVEDATIKTSSVGDDTLLMYRDSFANNMIPLFSSVFETAHYSKMVPYNLTEIADKEPDLVVIERTERHINLLSKNTPYMYSPQIRIEATQNIESQSQLVSRIDGDFIIFEGFIDEAYIDEGDDVYLLIEKDDTSAAYVPFYLSSDGNLDTENEDDDSLQEGIGDSEFFSEVATDYGFRVILRASEYLKSGYNVSVLVKGSDTEQVSSVLSKDF